jgi:hypothetical protein
MSYIFVYESVYILINFLFPTAVSKSLHSGNFNDLNWFQLGLEISEWGFNDPKVQEFIMKEDLHFDLVISEFFFQESWLMFAHKFKAPIVGISKIIFQL